MNVSTGSDDYAELRLDVLHLDSLNPRLPAEVQGQDEPILLQFIAVRYNAIEIGRSIARHGYFRSEPLIVIQRGDGEYIVVEGNRRLVALRLLQKPDLAQELDEFDEWKQLSSGAILPDLIPAVVAPDRKAVAPIIGYRHISGIEPWDPYAKARFIANLIDREELSFGDVASLVGEPEGNIAAHYRNQAIVHEAATEMDLGVERAIESFGVFTRAMNSPALRSHIGAPGPGEIRPRTNPVPSDKGRNLRELFSWLFGDDGNPAVLGDSRQITKLGEVVESEDGLEVLRTTRDIEAAYVASGGLRERLLRRLNNAYTNLVAAREDIAEYASDEEVQDMLARCEDAFRELTDEADART